MKSNSTYLAARAACDPIAFGELYEQYFKRVYNYVRFRCCDALTADDLTSQVFERLLERIAQYRPERGAFEPWLFAIARNVVNGHYRKQRGLWLPWEFLQRLPATDPQPEEIALHHETEDALLSALSRLDERSRDLLSLKFAAGLTNRQVAQVSGLSETNVGVILFRALGRLRTALGEN
jgi:RNA polymerase sigma-70 factor (ECF subfamily)